MSKSEALNALSNYELRLKKRVAIFTLGATALILVFFVFLYLSLAPNNPDVAESLAIVGGVVLAVSQLVGFGYLSVMRQRIHEERMALMDDSLDKQKNNKRKNSD
jgi:hypothetical protein